jgi:hypothetical protein
VRKTLRYPDKLQLFVGNLPHNTLESELKEYFSGVFYMMQLVRTALGYLKISQSGYM